MEAICRTCQNYPPVFIRSISAYLYDDQLGQAIYALKYQNNRVIAAALAEAALKTVDSHYFANVTSLCAVPLHPERLAQRGYNQSELLAAHLAAKLEIHLLPLTALQRDRATPSQTTLTMEQRRRNVADAFVAEPQLVSEQVILLIDDVCTTGATLDASAQALLSAGAEQVYCLTVARA